MLMSRFSDLHGLLRVGLTRSLASLVIKVATAGLTYLAYVVLSRVMDQTEYGYFAFGLSLATVLSIAASMGQQTAILRYWPEEMVAGRRDRALNALRSGAALMIIAGLAITAGVILASIIVDLFGGGPVAHLFAGASLVLPMAAAEYFSSALRAQGSVWTALTPRDVLWRLALPLAVLGLYATGVVLVGWTALLLTAVLLILSLAVQVWAARARRYEIAPVVDGLPQYWREHGTATRWFVLGTLVDTAALNMDIILVGLFVSPDHAGIYFNAFRTAGLLTLFMFAITLVAAPMVAQHYHAGEMRKAQAITAFCAWAGFLFSLVVFIGFVVFGDVILGLFGGSHEDGVLILVLLSIGLLFDAATGPSRIVMMMTGHERAYVRIFGTIMVLGMVAQVAVIPMFGVLGAAWVNMLARIIAQIAIAWFSRRVIGLDTSLLGLLSINRLSDQPRPAAAN